MRRRLHGLICIEYIEFDGSVEVQLEGQSAANVARSAKGSLITVRYKSLAAVVRTMCVGVHPQTTGAQMLGQGLRESSDRSTTGRGSFDRGYWRDRRLAGSVERAG